MSAISTHVLDTARGRPAAGVPVVLELQTAPGQWEKLGAGGVTDADGRIAALLPPGVSLRAGIFRLTFDTSACYQDFYPCVTVVFRVDDPARHYHVPLLLSPYGYTTYRGS